MEGSLSLQLLSSSSHINLSMQFVPSMVYAELSQSVGHAEYLTHIIQNYEMLDERMIFTKAKLAAASIPGMMKLLEAVDLALAGEMDTTHRVLRAIPNKDGMPPPTLPSSPPPEPPPQGDGSPLPPADSVPCS